jgi:hypothetical protein
MTQQSDKAAIKNAYFNEYFEKTVGNDNSRAATIFHFGKKNVLKETLGIDALAVGVIALMFLNPPAAVVPAFIVVFGTIARGVTHLFCEKKMCERTEDALTQDIDNGVLVDRYHAEQAKEKQQKIETLQAEISALQGKTAKADFSGAASAHALEGKTATPTPTSHAALAAP